MPFPIAAAAIGAVARGVATTAIRGAMTGARFGVRGAAGAVARTAVSNSLSSSQFGTTNPSLGNPGNAVTEPLRFGADMRVGTDQ
jgi:hypothetical protein